MSHITALDLQLFQEFPVELLVEFQPTPVLEALLAEESEGVEPGPVEQELLSERSGEFQPISVPEALLTEESVSVDPEQVGLKLLAEGFVRAERGSAV